MEKALPVPEYADQDRPKRPSVPRPVRCGDEKPKSTELSVEYEKVEDIIYRFVCAFEETVLNRLEKGDVKQVHLVDVPDPIVAILRAFEDLPVDDQSEMFTDFVVAGESRDLRTLQDTISDWAATAELYANEDLHSQVINARKEFKGIEGWLNGL